MLCQHHVELNLSIRIAHNRQKSSRIAQQEAKKTTTQEVLETAIDWPEPHTREQETQQESKKCSSTEGCERGSVAQVD